MMDPMEASHNEPEVEEHYRTLFLGDLSWFCQDSDVYQAFSRSGQVEDIRLIRSKENQCLGYGFITFKTVQDAFKAMNDMNGQVLVGRKLKIKWAVKRTEKAFKTIKQKDLPKVQSAQLHFSFISKQSNYVVTEANIRAIFQQFGDVQDICMKKIAVDKFGEQTGYGFIHYPLTSDGLKSAFLASQVVHQLFVDNVLYDSCLTHALETFLHDTQGITSSHPSKPTLMTGNGPDTSFSTGFQERRSHQSLDNHQSGTQINSFPYPHSEFSVQPPLPVSKSSHHDQFRPFHRQSGGPIIPPPEPYQSNFQTYSVPPPSRIYGAPSLINSTFSQSLNSTPSFSKPVPSPHQPQQPQHHFYPSSSKQFPPRSSSSNEFYRIDPPFYS